MDLIFDRPLGNVADFCREVSDPFERLKHLLVRHIGLILENHAIPRIIFSEEVYSGNPDRKAKLNREIGAYFKRISEIIQQGQGEKRIRNDVDYSMTVAVMF